MPCPVNFEVLGNDNSVSLGDMGYPFFIGRSALTHSLNNMRHLEAFVRPSPLKFMHAAGKMLRKIFVKKQLHATIVIS